MSDARTARARPGPSTGSLRAACVLVVFVIMALGQPYYPATWLDEGFVLGGARSLVRDGAYGLRSSEGIRVLDEPLVANGPGVVLPVAAVWKILGPGLPQARGLMVVFACLAAWAFFGVARRLSGARAAVVSTGLLLALPMIWKPDDAAGFVVFGRQALGNVPALCYFLIGFLLWHRGQVSGRAAQTIGGGVFFGLATVTKSPYLMLVPAIVLVAVLEFASTRDRRAFAAPALLLLCIAAWQAAWWTAQAQLVGWEGFGAHLEAIRSTSRTTVTAFRPSRIPGSIGYLVRSGYAAVVLPSLAYAAWRSRPTDIRGRSQLLLVTVVVLWTLWYALVSVGWPRYAFEPFAVGLLLSGQAVVSALGRVRKEAERHDSWPFPAAAGSWALAFLVLAFAAAAVGAYHQVTRPFHVVHGAPQAFAAHLRDHVPPGAVVESWEWELDILADLTYHHPDTVWVDRHASRLQFGDAIASDYDPLVHGPAYLIDGPFSKWTRIYATLLAAGCCELLHTEGPYDLYRVAQHRP